MGSIRLHVRWIPRKWTRLCRRVADGYIRAGCNGRTWCGSSKGYWRNSHRPRLAPPGESARVPTDPEKEADRWVRKYVRSQSVVLPSMDVVSLLLARTTYAATFARLAPRQDAELSTSKAAEVVEIL